MSNLDAKTLLTGLYITAYDRAPDQAGLNYWLEGLNAAEDTVAAFTDIADQFVNGRGFEIAYPEGLSTEEFVNQAYLNLYGRDGDAEGVAYWTNLIDNEGMDKGQFISDVVIGLLSYEDNPEVENNEAQLLNQLVFTNKIAVASYYVETLGAATNMEDSQNYAEDAAFQKARDVIAGVTEDPATVDAAKAKVDQWEKEFGTNQPENLTEAVALYSEKLAEEAAAQEKQQDVANEVAENELLEDAGLEADEDDNYGIEEVEVAVDTAVTTAETAVIDASQNSLGSATPINEQSIAVARDYLTGEVADAQKDVDALKGPKLTAAKSLQKKLDAYQKAADAVEKAVVDANKAGVALAANNIGSNGKSEIADVAISKIDINGSFEVKIETTSSDVFVIYDADGGVVYSDKTESPTDASTAAAAKTAFEDIEGHATFLKSLEKIHTSLLAVPVAEEAVKAAVGPLLAAEGYSLVKFDSGEASNLTKAVAQPWSALPWSATGTLDTSGLITGATPVGGDLGLVKAGNPTDTVVNIGTELNSALYTPAGTPDAITGAIAGALDKFADGLTKQAATDVTPALDALSGAKDALDTFNEKVAEWKELAELQEKLEAEAENVEAAAEAVEEAEELFEDLGVELVKADNGVATGSVYDENSEDQLADLFVFQKGLTEVDNFDGNDILYFGQSPDGSAYNLVVLGKNETITGDVGSVNAFDIFAVQDGANTTLYIEEKAFAGNGSTKADLIEVELVGVTAADLVINDGFLTLA